jgi:Uma2 family endonuclease
VNRQSSGVKLTWDDFVQFPDDGRRHELIDGEHVVTPSPVRQHQRIVMNLAAPLLWYLRDHPIGTMFNVPLDVILSPHDVVEPDLLYFSHEREKRFEPSDWVKGAPNLVVEVASPATKRRDETLKRRLYERAGVDEYWLVDPASRSVLVLRLEDGGYVEAARLSAADGDALTTLLLPGFNLSLDTLFAA